MNWRNMLKDLSLMQHPKKMAINTMCQNTESHFKDIFYQ